MGYHLHALWSNSFIPMGVSDVIEREIEFEVVEQPGRNECEGAGKAVVGLAHILECNSSSLLRNGSLKSGFPLWQQEIWE